jgi:hypothetical protein
MCGLVGLRNGWMCGLQMLITFFSGWVGLQKLITDLDMRNGYKGGVRVVFININDMYNNDVGMGGVRVYEAYEVKQRMALVRVPFYFINLLPTSLLHISILL